MSNQIYDFLAESILFQALESKYKNVSLKTLISELNDYKNYINQNLDSIKKESIDASVDYSVTAPLSLTNNSTSTSELINGALFLDRYIVDDPLYSQDYNNLEILNYGRKLLSANPFSEEDIKNEIYEACSFLKSLTPLVKSGIEYIKVLPLTRHVIERNLESFNIPDLSLDHIDDNAFKWMANKLKVFNRSL